MMVATALAYSKWISQFEHFRKRVSNEANVELDIETSGDIGLDIEGSRDVELDVEGSTGDGVDVEVSTGGGLDDVDPYILMHIIEQAESEFESDESYRRLQERWSRWQVSHLKRS